MDIREIIMSLNMSARPGYYAGRSAEYHDLDSTTLNKIADLIKEHYGNNAHDNYVKMVWQIEHLSASAFLNNLYTLQAYDWNLSEMNINERNDIIESHDEAWGLLLTSMSKGALSKSSEKLASDSIRKGFRTVV